MHFRSISPAINVRAKARDPNKSSGDLKVLENFSGTGATMRLMGIHRIALSPLYHGRTWFSPSKLKNEWSLTSSQEMHNDSPV